MFVRPHVWLITGFFAAAAFLTMALGPVRAQETVTVTAGESAIILSVTGTITDPEARSGGVAAIVEPTEPTPTTHLIYLPRPGDIQASDLVTYELNGTPASIAISITPSSPLLTDSAFYEASFKALFALFILAVLIESGLALIFRWRPFLSFFDSRTVNALVAFVFAYFLVDYFDLDIATRLISIYSGDPYDNTIAGMVLTALIIAGGSAGVNRIFRTFGFRPPSAAEQQPPKPEKTEAWFAVMLVRDKAVGPVNVLIGPPNAAAVAGTIVGSSWKRAWWRFFLRDKGRFPQSAGYAMPASGGPYVVIVEGVDADDKPLKPAQWGPYPVAKGGIIDIELTL